MIRRSVLQNRSVFDRVRISAEYEYDATIADLEDRRTELGGVMPRDQAAIDAVTARIAEAREEKRQFVIATRAEIDSNLEKWTALGAKKEEDVITSDFTNAASYTEDEHEAGLAD